VQSPDIRKDLWPFFVLFLAPFSQENKQTNKQTKTKQKHNFSEDGLFMREAKKHLDGEAKDSKKSFLFLGTGL